MASFEGSIGTPDGRFNLMVEYSVSQSIDGNYSDISATGYVKRNSSSVYPYNGYGGDGNLSINGDNKYQCVPYDLRSDGYKQIMSHSSRVYHNSDGTKGITISFSFNGNLSSYYPNGSISQYITLPTIPRASDIGCSSPYIGDSATITISKKSSSLTSTIWYQFGNITNTIANKTYDTVLSFNTNSVKSQLYAQIPNATQGYGTMYCDTYSGNTLIGRKSCQFYLYAKESDCKPTVSAVFKDIKSNTIQQTGNENIIIKGQSFAQATISATPKYSSSISSYSVTCNDGQKDTNQVSVIYRPKNSIFKVTAKDSRGYSTTEQYNLSQLNQWLDYIELAYTSDISVKRSEQLSDEVILNVEGNYFNGKLGTTAGFRNIQVGDDLSGKTIYCDFPYYFYYQIYKETNLEKDVIVASKKITQNSDNEDEFSSTIKADSTNIYYCDENEIEHYLTTYTLPNDFGVVTSIDSDAVSYEYIKILSDDTPVDNNNLLSMYFQYKLSSAINWSNQVTINPTISGNKFSVTNLTLGDYFSHNQEYVFRVIVQDKLMTVGTDSNTYQVVTKATPVVRIGEELVQVNGELLIGESSLVNQYSTSEVKTHLKWIDGKPIYRKVVEVNFPTNDNDASTNHYIDNIDMIINCELIWYDTVDKRFFQTFKDTTGTYYIELNGVSNTKIVIKNSTNFNWDVRTKNKYAIIDYTKTID